MKKLVLILATFLTMPLLLQAGPLDWTSGEKVSLPLKRGDFVILRYPAKTASPSLSPKALILFGSGCGGWSYWEENVCHKLQASGYEVLGIDFSLYAQSDFDQNTVEQDYQTVVNYGWAPYGKQAPPVVIGGWSTGAEQAVAIAGGPHPPSGLVGLLLISPGSEGGYGSYATSYLDLTAPSSKLFRLADFDSKLSNLRVAQWHAEFDPLDSRAWLGSLKAPHMEYDFPDAIHDYHGACPDFLTKLADSVAWLLHKSEASSQPSKGAASHSA